MNGFSACCSRGERRGPAGLCTLPELVPSSYEPGPLPTVDIHAHSRAGVQCQRRFLLTNPQRPQPPPCAQSESLKATGMGGREEGVGAHAERDSSPGEGAIPPSERLLLSDSTSQDPSLVTHAK